MRVLAGDIGGTKTLLLLAEYQAGHLRLAHEQRYDSHAYGSLLPMVREFLSTGMHDGLATIDACCFGIAGPVEDRQGVQHAAVTNLPWVVDSVELAQSLDIARLRLINDFQAVGYGVEALVPADVAVLQAGEARSRAPCAIIGAGTGLGQGLLIWHHDHYDVVATEGGHVDFAPTDALQIELLQYLTLQYGRVSYERLLSGSGLVNIYRFLKSRDGQCDPAEKLDAAAVTGAAFADRDACAVQALEVFVKIYGAQAGNLALTCLAQGGVYVAGGIAPKILVKLKQGGFLRAFLDKGRMSVLLRQMPVQVILNPKAGLLGAAMAATRL